MLRNTVLLPRELTRLRLRVDITKIQFIRIRNAVFKTLIFDKDNTLTATDKIDIDNAEIVAAVQESQEHF
jgi:predicted HAD superfamily phosphohydrolase YqeG